MSDWIEWKGGECPVPADTPVWVRFADGMVIDDEPAGYWAGGGDDYWKHASENPDDHIVAYRINYPTVAFTRIAALEQQVKTLREALEKCAAWFQDYANGHAAKGDTDKATRNLLRADLARAALAATEDSANV